jgi:dTDP-4-dehydrorhamnose reductase
MRVVIIGANGQLGTDLVRVLREREVVIPLTHRKLEVCDFARTREVLVQTRPDIVINTAAFVQVDRCEDEVERSFQVNTYAVRNLAQICQELGSLLVHLSTDYVFDGKKRKPYLENDIPHPLSVYGVSKLAGEYFVRALCERHLVVRSSGLYGLAGSSGKGGNFVETMINMARAGGRPQKKPIRVVDDQILVPTYTRDLAEAIVRLIDSQALGLYHLTSDGECSWYEFAQRIFTLLGLSPDLSPTTTEAFAARARRPAYSVLRSARLAWRLRPWPQALAEYLQERGHLPTPAKSL